MKKLSILLLTIFTFAACDFDDHNIVLNKTVEDFIEDKYEGAKILQAESEGLGTIEVEFIHDGRKKTAYFVKRSNDWIYTTWDVTIGEVPDIVKETLQNSYPDYVIEDINYVERPNANYYEFELEKGIIEITRYITPDGELL
ncbi:MAG: PepSY-like domain-containing protein [Bacteroidaceae bacterium]|nr:PepSY-like domain-containing protein [Bacteroidaceae bacterium]